MELVLLVAIAWVLIDVAVVGAMALFSSGRVAPAGAPPGPSPRR